ncbi:MAG TPA: hypothetical protein VKA54_14325 [Gemmatimonadaceae bacterium]|nr:hypothetical protein [Gemmatimonadaceae bacterium]
MVGTTPVLRNVIMAAGMLAILTAADTAQAQRRDPRIGVAAQPRPEPTTGPRRDPAWYGAGDPRRRPDPRRDDRRIDHRSHGPTVIYVPVPADYGYGYGYGAGSYYGGAYYPTRLFGGVTDANGRPLYSDYDSRPTTGGSGYTPDLSGTPYTVSDEGMMVVDFPTGERRAFPSCAEASDARDPQGRPRTIFYRSPDYWMVLRPGQRGRVHGEPPPQAKACYAIDSTGRVVLRY